MEAFVYLLFSSKDHKTYLGSTDNLERRLREHCDGKCVATRHRRPLRVIYTEKHATLSGARTREHFLKTRKGRRELKKIFSKLRLNGK